MKANHRLRGWIRAATKKSDNAQREALAAVGCVAIYVAGEDTIDGLIAELRKGDMVCMTTFARASNHRADLAPIRKAIHAKGATILEVSTGRRSECAGDMADMMGDAVSELTGEARAFAPGDAKRLGSKGGKAKGKNAKAARTPEAEAKSVWYDPKGGTVRERLARAEMRGWSVVTAYRKLGKTR